MMETIGPFEWAGIVLGSFALTMITTLVVINAIGSYRHKKYLNDKK